MNFIVYAYEPLPEVLTMPFLQWKYFIHLVCLTKHGGSWIFKHAYPQHLFASRNEPLALSLTSPPAAKTVRLRFNKNINWRPEYICPCVSNKRVQSDRQAGETTGQMRLLQKASKKIGCECRLVVTCSHSDAENPSLSIHGVHKHSIGTADDL